MHNSNGAEIELSPARVLVDVCVSTNLPGISLHDLI